MQFAFNTLSRVSPVSHGVCNVVKRIVIISTSVVFFGTTLTPKTKLGAACKPPLVFLMMLPLGICMQCTAHMGCYACLHHEL